MILNVIMVSFAGGILCLDRVVVQAMISRPIVAAPLIGLLLGDPYTGLVVGALLELLSIDQLPIGGYIPPNDALVSILITASSIEAGRILDDTSQGLIALSLLTLLPLGVVAKKMEWRLCMNNNRLANKAMSDAVRGDIRSFARHHLIAIAETYLLSVVVILVALPAAISILVWIYPRLAPWMVRGLVLTYSLLPLIGVSIVLNTIKLRRIIPIFCASFLTAATLFSLVRGG
jgi:PTS system mannose-specific IIC component